MSLKRRKGNNWSQGLQGSTKRVQFGRFTTVQGQATGGLNKLGVVNTSQQKVVTTITAYDGRVYTVVWDYDIITEKRALKHGAMTQRVRVSPAQVKLGLIEVDEVPADVHRKIAVKIQQAKKHTLREAKEEIKATERGAKTAHKVAKAVSEEATTWSEVVARMKGAPVTGRKPDEP